MCIVSKPSVRFLSPKLATLLSTVDQVNLTNGLEHFDIRSLAQEPQ